MMNKKVLFIVIITIVIAGIGFSTFQGIAVQGKYSKIFLLDATFHPDKKQVEIIFTDKTKQNTGITLEILGMNKSFQKTFDGPDFTIMVPFQAEPEYGWKTVPVTLVIDHPEFGKIGIKTDIHDPDQPSSLIFTEL